MKVTQPNHNQVWYLPRSLIIEEVVERRYILWSIAVICSIVFLLIIWAAFVKVYETAITYGQLEPVGEVHVVEHLEGGIVKQILVKDGDWVQANQPLVILDDTAFKSELQEMQARKLSLESDVARLKAFTDEKKFNVPQPELNDAQIKQIVSDDARMLEIQNVARNNQRAVVMAQIKQKEEDIKKYTQQKSINANSLKLMRAELEMYKQLLPKGYVSKRDYLRLEREYNQGQNEAAQIDGNLKTAQESLNEAKEKLAQLNSSLQQDAIKELANANSQLAEVNFRIHKLQDQVKRSVIVAPIAGEVKGLNLTEKSVVQAGQEILSIVPENQALELITKISTRDIGHIKIGDPVKVKMLTYDFARYGYIEGKLTKISATTFFDDKNPNNTQPYYKGTVSLSQQYVKSPENRLKAGMTAEADIVTGDKTILQYLLKPVRLISDSGLRER